MNKKYKLNYNNFKGYKIIPTEDNIMPEKMICLVLLKLLYTLKIAKT